MLDSSKALSIYELDEFPSIFQAPHGLMCVLNRFGEA